jgi:hypothetical protein
MNNGNSLKSQGRKSRKNAIGIILLKATTVEPEKDVASDRLWNSILF